MGSSAFLPTCCSTCHLPLTGAMPPEPASLYPCSPPRAGLCRIRLPTYWAQALLAIPALLLWLQPSGKK